MSQEKPGKGQSTRPRVVIVGGGCGGIEAARALRDTPVDVILIDRVNHYLFQALLYQVAGGMLDAGDIAFPIREVLQHHGNAFVAHAEVTGVDKEKRCVYASRRKHPHFYDYLILATGAEGSYFGHDEWSKFAPGLKTLRDGISLRSRILRAFERAEMQEDPRSRPELFTFVLVGGGPTGCEMAGALAEMVRHTLKSDFRCFDPRWARIILVDAAPRVLPSFSPDLSEKARVRLEKMGVEVRLGHAIEKIDEEGVVLGGERIRSLNVLWMAGVTASPAGRWLGVETDRAGRVKVAPDLTVPGHPEIFVVGDTALVVGENGKPLPGVAQVAMQEGRYAGRTISRRVAGQPPLPPFKYFDKGNLATIGRNYAILESGKLKLAGFAANLVWAFIHIYFLLQKEDRFVVFLKWAFNYITQRRSSRIIEEAVRCGLESDESKSK
ncbi:MAG TPA: NAD(P)/FAD-dependent oxidoreductase [Syntrophales bacterium]|nr:NAD(P)/FAD-dependent oxidoreductase [Syntrophales bacterium]HOX94367.1 NAD(P)/FAD-dependent oxidoreductase [Syntrophales bacterium]HPI57449.1 NAD(P)/FAD-dependent oxidoreductase [Syntrophales bacterium]HPN25694.1 NAD(P)/FAD-dependent oxidoreductase [Syntrophales bacterium]HQM29474.1 NAD(P)/FAD-dependent oxidoreductase [Syntrophales bacterium]